jgi:hypothetical protein
MNLVRVCRKATRPPDANRKMTSSSPRGALVALVGILAVLLAPGVALAEGDAIKLALTPIGSPGLYFDLTMRPGETQSLAVQLSNAGAAAISARTYAADVYTIINGGFGGLLRDDARTGTTRWLDYPTVVLQLPAGQGIGRKFTIAVPTDAGPGEYITSLVLENDQPISGDGSVSLDQIVRTAIAVVVTVPGKRSPGLSIGGATQDVVAGKSVVSIAVENTGNVRLKPVVTFTLIDATGAQVSQASLPMGTFYAHTKTFVEVPLAALLLPGAYAVRLSLDDAAQGVRADSAAISLIVDANAEAPTGEAGGSNPAGVRQDGGEGQVSLAGLGLVLVVGLVLGGALAGLMILVVWRHRRPRTGRAWLRPSGRVRAVSEARRRR